MGVERVGPVEREGCGVEQEQNRGDPGSGAEEEKTEEYDLALEEWLRVLAELWTAAGKALEADRLKVYRQSLGDVPLGLLELAVQRLVRPHLGQTWIQENPHLLNSKLETL